MADTDLLIIIDVQDSFCSELLTQDFEKKLKDYITKKHFTHIVATKYQNHEGSSCFRYLHYKGATKDKLYPFVKAVSERVFIKDTYSCFTKELLDFIREEKISKITLVGLDTDACVLASAFDAFDRGLDCTVELNLCFSSGGHKMHQSAKEVILRNLRYEE